MSNVAWVYLFCALGIVCRTVLPYLQTLRDSAGTSTFDWKYLVGPVASVVINLFLMPFLAQNLTGTESWAVAYVAGWGVSDMGREVQKVVEAVRNQG